MPEPERGLRHAPAPTRRLTLVTVIAFAALFVVMAWPAEDGGWTQHAHYALVRSLSHGTPRIDDYESETGDASYHAGHYFSAKAPGVAFLALPGYMVLHAVGVWPDDARAALWLITLVSSVLPALLLVALVARVANGFEPGSGLSVGLTLGIGTLVLPFAAMTFAHIWGALLPFACFAVLLRERQGADRLWLVAAAGYLSGLAVLFEYPTALAGFVLGLLAILRGRRLARGLAYAGGVLLGVCPLFAYNRWAFGSPFTLSYENAIIDKGTSGHDVIGAQSHGLFGVTAPSLRTLAELMLTERGLLIETPIILAGVVGLILLMRSGTYRAEGATALAISLLFPLYNGGVTTPFGGAFGGDTPGPRYLITALPFAIVALGVAYRRAPALVLALAAGSALSMVAATATDPLIGPDEVGLWWHGISNNEFVPTVALLLGWPSRSFAPTAPYFVGVAVVAVVAVRGFIALRRPGAAEIPAVVTAIAAWLFVVLGARAVLTVDPSLLDGLVALGLLAAAIALVGAVLTDAAGIPPRRPPDNRTAG